MNNPRHIPGEGRLDARLVLVGEAPGENEERLGRPFVGASGFKLNSWWQPLGLQRSDFYIDNVYPYAIRRASAPRSWVGRSAPPAPGGYRPPNNNLFVVDFELLQEWAADLHARIDALVDPYVIIPTGNTALRALMRRPLDDQLIKIEKYRGSIMSYVTNSGRTVKMIPTIHPAAIYHQRAKKGRGQEKANPGRTEKHCRLDWARIAAEAKFREVDAPVEEYFIADQLDDLAYWRDEFDRLGDDVPLTIDIETPRLATRDVDCVGFAWDARFAFSVPLRWPGLGDADHPTFAARRELIRHICKSPNPKILQNGFYDYFILKRKEGIVINNYIYDLMVMHHLLDPVDDHDLGYMKSILMRGEYHKDEAKQPEKAAKYASSYEAMLTYNDMDCCTQVGMFPVLRDRLIAAGRWQLYESLTGPLLEVLADIGSEGINTDGEQRDRGHARLTADLIGIQDQLEVLAGERLHAKVDLSPVKLKRFLFETLGLPPIHKRRKRDGTGGNITTEEVALRKLQLRYPQKAGAAITLILEHRRKAKLCSFLTPDWVDADGRLRCEVLPMTEGGRCSSRENPLGTGTNLFNQDRDRLVRSSYIPDKPNHVIVELDASQIESRLVYVMSGDHRLQRLAMLDPADFDQHAYNAHIVYSASRTKIEGKKNYEVKNHELQFIGYVDADQRYLGKRTVHGAQRGMGGEKLAELLLQEDIVMTPDECQRRIDRYLREHPGMDHYFEWVRFQVLRNKKLTTSWGFCWDVTYEKMDADLYRRAYSLLPQSECAYLIYSALVPTWHFINTWYSGRARILTSVYDSIVLSVENDPLLIYNLLAFMWERLAAPRTYATRTGPFEFSMYGEAKIGRNWALDDGIEFKRLPTREEIATALATKLAIAA